MFTVILLAQFLSAATPSAGESQAQEAWMSSSFGQAAAAAPFSFTFGDRKSTEALAAWPLERKTTGDTSTLTWRDAVSGLEVRSEITRYADYPAVEWVVYFKNNGATDTPILDDIQALDCGIPLPREKAAWLHHAKGSECRQDDFAPITTPLGPDERNPQVPQVSESKPLHFESREGRSSSGALPFFNLDMGGRGVIGAVGWTGNWAATFFRTDTDVRLRAGMQRTHLKLLPGEEIRSPRIMLLFWEGDRAHSQNLLRQFILAHHRPQVDGQPAQVPICNGTWGANSVDMHIAHAQFWKDQGLPMEYLWIDAGWFGVDLSKEDNKNADSVWWRNAGDWHPNPRFYPNGLKPVGDALKSMGMKFMLWLEPERVFKGTPWTREHPEWLLGPVYDNYLYNLAIPEARKALADFLSNLIEENSIGCYRQDFNMDIFPFWKLSDAPDRVGIAEIQYITGLYALWDELLARHPGLLIDNCASGGRRIDLETISRSIPMWRSDVESYPYFSVTSVQAQTQGLGAWVPLSAACCGREDTYAFRSALGPGMVIVMYDFEMDANKHFSTPWLKDRLAELTTVRKYFLGDFYPLLSYSTDDDGWAAWQYDRPDLAEGIVIALRRPASPFTSMTPKLQGLDPSASYEFTDADTGAKETFTGKVLTESGLKLDIATQPGSKLLIYKKVQ